MVLRTNYTNTVKQDDLQYLKEVVDLGLLLHSLGFTNLKETQKEFRGPCIIHGGDNASAFRLNKKRRTWVCFTNKCNEIEGNSNDLVGLIRAVNKCSFPSAVMFLKKLVGDFSSQEKIEYKIQKNSDEFKNRYLEREIKKPRIVSEQCLRAFLPIRSDRFLKDGFSKKTLDYFEVGGGYTDIHGYVRDVIPIRNFDGELVAYSLRDIRDKVDHDSKYILTENFNKDKVLYNLHRAIKNVYDGKPLILVEGFKSVWRFYEYGIPNVAAIMGSALTQGQLYLLIGSGVKEVILMLDNDKAGVKGTTISMEMLKGKLLCDVVFITETDEKGKGLDPSDLPKETVYEYLKNYI